MPRCLRAGRYPVLIYCKVGEMQRGRPVRAYTGPLGFRVISPSSSLGDVVATRLGQIPERLLGQLWKERAARQGEFRSKSGQRYRVIYPGRSSSGAGPDFRGAVLEEEGVGLVTGDVELHLDEKDWRSHGHGNDPRYNGVVLHAVVETEAGTTTLQNGNRVPVISLAEMLNEAEAANTPSRLWELLSARGYPCPDSLEELTEMLGRAGDAWFEGTVDGFRILLEAGEEPEQTLYSGIMEAMGYSQNRQGFLDLARLVPYRRLQSLLTGRVGEDAVSSVAQGLLKAAGFGIAGPGPGEARVLDGARRHLKWNTFRVRPPNHPRNRILGAARLLERYLGADAVVVAGEAGLGKGLVGGLKEILEASPEDDAGRGCKDLLAGLMVAPVNGGPTGRGSVGKERAADIAVNVVLPFYRALAERAGWDSLADKCAGMYRVFPRLQPNEIILEMEEQLGRHLSRQEANDGSEAPQPKARSYAKGAREQQGLLHLHHLMTSPSVARR